MRVPPDYNPTSRPPSPLCMDLYLNAFEDDLFNNDKTYFVSDILMTQDDCSNIPISPLLSTSTKQFVSMIGSIPTVNTLILPSAETLLIS